jgi:hypothetical protein
MALGEPDAARAALRDGLEFAADSAAARALRELSAQQRTGGR